MMRRIIFLALALFLFTLLYRSGRLNAQNVNPLLDAKGSANGLEVSDYRKVRVSIEKLPEDARKIGLTEERIRTECELRLWQAGLESVPPSGRSERLYVNINVVSSAFNIDLEFKRKVFFEVKETLYVDYGITTWSWGTTGMHGGNPEYIVQSLDGLLHEFLNEYLKANLK